MRYALRAAVAAALATIALAPAAAATPDRLAPRFPDRVIREPSRDLRAVAAAAAGSHYADGDGHSVLIERDSAYTSADAQHVADVLGSFSHGSEMNRLHVLLATPQHITSICGQGVLACYFPGGERMVVSGRNASAAGGEPSRDFVLAHEYGHHVAENRDNSPWDAIDYGTKRWASYEGVCSGVRSHRYFPGDQGSHYWDDPGENFAEAYAFMAYPLEGIGWDYNATLRPDQRAFARISDDVLSPWRGNRVRRWSDTLPASRRSRSRSVDVAWDGRMRVTLNGAAGADFDLYVLAPSSGKVLARSESPSADETIRYNVCGRTGVLVEVYRYSGSGAFTAEISRP